MSDLVISSERSVPELQSADQRAIELTPLLRRLAAPAQQIARWKEALALAAKTQFLDKEGDIRRAWTRDEPEYRRACARLATFPPGGEVEEWGNRINEATFGKANQAETLTLIGIMLDGFRTRDTGALDTFMAVLGFLTETLDEDDDLLSRECRWEREAGLDGFSPEAIAWAVRAAWRKGPFPPSSSEFIDLLKKARFRLWEASRTLEHMSRLIAEADFIKAAAEANRTVGEAEAQ